MPNTIVNINFRDAFEESKHPRKGGKFAKSSGNASGPAVKNGEVKGGAVVEAGKHAAHENLVDQIHLSGGGKISREDAHHVAKFYVKNKLAKLDHISRRGSVKNGAYLEPDVVQSAVGMAKEAKK